MGTGIFLVRRTEQLRIPASANSIFTTAEAEESVVTGIKCLGIYSLSVYIHSTAYTTL